MSLLKSLAAHNDYFIRAAVAEALLTAPPAEAIPILGKMTVDTRPAAWALIRLGKKAEPAIVEIMEDPKPAVGGHGSQSLIREYYEHWKELPAKPSPAIVAAIHDRVQADGGQDTYGREVLKFAGDPFVAHTAWQDLKATLSSMASKGQEMRKKLLLSKQFTYGEAPEGFLKDAEAGNLRIRRVLADRTDALAHVADQKGEINFVLGLSRVGLVWSIGYGWTTSPDNVQDRISGFLRSHSQAKEVGADDASP